MSQNKPSVAHDVIELIQSYGPNLAGWVIAFCLFTWFMGWGGKMAMDHVKSLLEEGEKLRQRLKDELKECENGCRRRDAMIRSFTNEMVRLREMALAEAKDRDDAHRRNMERERQLLDDIDEMRAEIAVLNRQLDYCKINHKGVA